MSLILDALRKSAGDRQRGHAPTLASAVGLTPRRRAVSARVPVALALLAGTAGVGWWLGFGTDAGPESMAGGVADREDAGQPADASMAGAEAGRRLASAPALADSPPALRPEAVQLPLDDLEPRMGESQARLASGLVAAGGAAALPLPAGTVYTPESMVAGDVAAPPIQAPAPPPAAMAAAPEVSPQPPVSAQAVTAPVLATTAPASPDAAAETLQTVDELDYSVRRELPSLDISMYVYHADPERRFLIIDGKRYPRVDGSGMRVSRIDDKVDLLEIRADGAVLELNGQRFLLPRGR
ncbi:MAG: general secretion pathway protein GspB [Xanthomonadales bacterium]|jgi:hypothetical protein|nr:general secretion pathway protein GspB [Xanthomonadales bacterium]